MLFLTRHKTVSQARREARRLALHDAGVRPQPLPCSSCLGDRLCLTACSALCHCTCTISCLQFWTTHDEGCSCRVVCGALTPKMAPQLAELSLRAMGGCTNEVMGGSVCPACKYMCFMPLRPSNSHAVLLHDDCCYMAIVATCWQMAWATWLQLRYPAGIYPDA